MQYTTVFLPGQRRSHTADMIGGPGVHRRSHGDECLLILTLTPTKSCELHADLLDEANDFIISLPRGRRVAHLIERCASSFGANGFVVASIASQCLLSEILFVSTKFVSNRTGC